MTVVVLADDRPGWRPGEWSQELAGTRVGLTFPVAKLLDWEPHQESLRADPNPFATVVLAHLASLRTRKDADARLDCRWALVPPLYERHGEEDVLELHRMLDWLLGLPPEQQREFNRRRRHLEEEQHMRYVASYEREAREEGLRDAILTVLETRFGPVTPEVTARVRAIASRAALDTVLRASTSAKNVDEALAAAERGGGA